jgi:hypothetical protein
MRRPPIDRGRGSNQGGSQPQGAFYDRARFSTRAICTVLTCPGFSGMDVPKSKAQTSDRYGNKDPLIGFEHGQIADPRAADAEAQQEQRSNAAGGCKNRTQCATACQQSLGGLLRLIGHEVQYNLCSYYRFKHKLARGI